MNVFDRLNTLNTSEAIEADKIADSISTFLVTNPDATQYQKVELYNRWIQQEAIIPSGDNVARWAFEYLCYVTKEISVEWFKLQIGNCK